uniref:Uncharacterized protein n=1 Tax=Anguilla anguilla TaxID=7936 RepID=A0A0E9QSW9_ANGAN
MKAYQKSAKWAFLSRTSDRNRYGKKQVFSAQSNPPLAHTLYLVHGVEATASRYTVKAILCVQEKMAYCIAPFDQPHH